MKTNYHAGHRSRMRARWRSGSPMEEHELLEMLLYYAIPRRNTNEIAHALLERFGSLRGILRADKKELRKIVGVGETVEVFFGLLTEVVSRYLGDGVQKDCLLTSAEALCVYLGALYIGVSEEVVTLLLFSSNGRLLCTEKISNSFSTMSEISTKKMYKLAVQYNASFAVLAHNHPNGIAAPSDKDLITTKQIRETLALLGVKLVDHWIVTDEECVSILSEIEQAENL